MRISSSIPDELKLVLEKIQQELFNLGGELSMPDSEMINSDAIKYLESALDKLNDKLTALKNFVLPGGSRSAANCHIARAICRRAERRLLGLSRISRVNKNSLRYLNRLSDLLFVIARSINKYEGTREILWKQNQS